MKKKNYVIAKKSSNGEITFIDYSKIDGFKVNPKNNINYPGIEINSMILIKPIFIEKILKRKIKRKLNLYLNYIVEESNDDSGDNYDQVLSNIDRYRGIVEYKYRKYLDDKYINLLLKKINILDREIKAKALYKKEYIDKKEKYIEQKIEPKEKYIEEEVIEKSGKSR